LIASGRWSARCYNEQGDRRRQGGFSTKAEAAEWLDRKLGEVRALRRGDRPATIDIPTVTQLVDTFLSSHEVDPATTSKLRYELVHATRAFGETRIDQLRTPDLAAWRATLPARSRHRLFASFRQVLGQAVTWQLSDSNPQTGSATAA
jgi:hypothetical protein